MLQSITVTPADSSIPAGGTTQFTATGMYSDKSIRILSNQVTWASASDSVATISTPVSKGVALGASMGTSSISATLGGAIGTATLTVTPRVLQSIMVTPDHQSVPTGGTTQFTATGTYSDLSTIQLTTEVTWASASLSVATIANDAGSQGVATAVAAGTSAISATVGGVTGSVLFTVSPAVLQTIAVTAADLSVPAGGTEQFGHRHLFRPVDPELDRPGHVVVGRDIGRHDLSATGSRGLARSVAAGSSAKAPRWVA